MVVIMATSAQPLALLLLRFLPLQLLPPALPLQVCFQRLALVLRWATMRFSQCHFRPATTRAVTPLPPASLPPAPPLVLVHARLGARTSMQVYGQCPRPRPGTLALTAGTRASTTKTALATTTTTWLQIVAFAPLFRLKTTAARSATAR